MSVNILSEIDLLLSNVNVELSSVSFKMSRLPVNVKPKYLPRIGVLLSTIESLVSSSSSSTTSSSCSSSCSDLAWDSNHDFYVYSDEEDASITNTIDEFDIDVLPACGEECVKDLADCDEERVIAIPTSGEKCGIDELYSSEYHRLMFPTANQVSQMFPAAMVSSMFQTNLETMMSSTMMSLESVTSSMMSLESMTSSMTSDSNTTEEWIYYDDYWKVEEDMTTKLIKFINISAPGAVFSITKSRRRRRKKINRLIHPELRSIFTNSLDLCSPTPTAAAPMNRPPVPIVDWIKVNQRSLNNLPQPKMFPKHGCSDDPIIYEPVIDDHGCVRVTHPAPHKKPFPFGGEFGLMTDLGVISTNKGDHMDDPYNNIMHGHVWSRELCCWVIHARFAKDKDSVINNPKGKERARNSKKPKKEEVESR